MKVGVLIDRWEPRRGGAERALAALVEHLLDTGDEVHVYADRAAEDAPGAFHAVDVPRLPRGEWERALAERSVRAARADGCERVLGIRHAESLDVYWPHGGLHRATLAAGEASRGRVGGALSRLVHRLSPKHRAFLEMEARLLTGGAARTWCVSALVRDEIAAGFPERADTLEIHWNGVDRERFRPDLRAAHRDALLAELELPADRPLMLHFGGNWRLKGWAVLLAALESVSHTPWTLLAAGARSERVKETVPAALRDRVRVIPPGDATRLLGAADLLVQPTYRDPCSLATLEALASGVPVVTTTANGAAEVVRRGAAGAVTAPGDPAALAAALSAWLPRLADPAERETAASAARAASEPHGRQRWLAGLAESLRR